MNIFLHIGHHKTATTSFQRTCEAFRSDLLAKGIAYPQSVGANNHQHGNVLVQVTKQRLDQHLVPHLDEWLSIHCETLILSAESLVECPTDEGRKLINKLKRHGNVHIVYSLRNWTEFLPSRYAQYMKVGDSWIWTDFLAACKTDFEIDPNLNFGRVIAEFGAGQPDSFHLLDYRSETGPSDLLNLTGVEASLGDNPAYQEMRNQIRNSRFPDIYVETQRIVNMMINLKHDVSPSRCFFNRDLRNHVRRVKHAGQNDYLGITRLLLSDPEARTDINMALQKPTTSLPQDKRPDFSIWAKRVDAIAAEFDLPQYAKNWMSPSGQEFWTCQDIRAEDLPMRLRNRINEEIARVEAAY